jgi:hypothetical protein
MVVDAGDDLAFASVGQEQAGGDVELPQLHRRRAFPPDVLVTPPAARHRLDQLMADQDPVDRGPGHTRIAAAVQLEHQTARSPPAVRPPQLADQSLDLGADPPRMLFRRMGPVGQAGDAVSAIPRHPPVHRLPGHAIPLGDLDRRNPGQHFQHGPVPLLDHVQLPKHERERHRSSGATVSHIKRSQTSAPCAR